MWCLCICAQFFIVWNVQRKAFILLNIMQRSSLVCTQGCVHEAPDLEKHPEHDLLYRIGCYRLIDCIGYVMDC